jgi:hypothetical protein
LIAPFKRNKLEKCNTKWALGGCRESPNLKSSESIKKNPQDALRIDFCESTIEMFNVTRHPVDLKPQSNWFGFFV